MRILLLILFLFSSAASAECSINKATLGDYLATRMSNGGYTWQRDDREKKIIGSLRFDFNHLLDRQAALFPRIGLEPICPPHDFLPKYRFGAICGCGWAKWMDDVPNIGPEILQDYLEQTGHTHSSDEGLRTVLISALQDKWPCGFVQRTMNRIAFWMWE
jgi:hypothetical protein